MGGHANPQKTAMNPADPDPRAPGLVLCSDLARIPAVGHCTPGAGVAAVPLHAFRSLQSNRQQEWRAAPITRRRSRSCPPR